MVCLEPVMCRMMETGKEGRGTQRRGHCQDTWHFLLGPVSHQDFLLSEGQSTTNVVA